MDCVGGLERFSMTRLRTEKTGRDSKGRFTAGNPARG